MDSYHILVPMDFSDCSHAALRYAVRLARVHTARLTLLHVDPGIVPLYDEQLGILEPSRLMRVVKLRAEEYAVRADVPIEESVIYGDPTKKIVEVAANSHSDLIVMGTHGRSGLSRVLMGSVAKSVLRNAPCPVLFVKETTPQPRTDDAGAQSATSKMIEPTDSQSR